MKFLFPFFCILFLTLSCSSPQKKGNDIFSPEEAIQDLQIEDGFEVQRVLSEPQVEAPVTLTFDEDGKMWVVEMPGYMQDKDGAGENLHVGRIKIFEDQDNDGEFETSSIFLDSLVMPRTVSIVKGGVLVIEPPKLFFVENNNGVAGKRIMIDSVFAEEGNVEHQPNGLIYGIDNWLYSAKSDKRVRFINGSWKVESTFFRGQWGISHDDFGRLFYNNNSVSLLVDNFLPNAFGENVNHTLLSKDIRDVRLVSNQVFPRRPTPGVNRGYQEGSLDSTGRLINTTASSGPVVYRGNNFPKEYYGNVFVSEPAGFLVKRIIIHDDGNNRLKGEFAYQNNEFLTATDERFRPVSLCNAPDGSLYMVDMHRGLVQHTTYLTPYLRHYVDSFRLEQPISMGRIYRIKWKVNALDKNPHIDKATSQQLVKNLSHPNGWVRDISQRLLVDRADKNVSEELKELAFTSENPVTRIHALWTLEGLQELSPAWLGKAAQTSIHPYVYQSCMKLLELFPADRNALIVLKSLRTPDDKMTEIQFVNSLGVFHKAFWPLTKPLLTDVIARHENDPLFTDAILKGLAGKEKEFLKSNSWTKADTIFPKALKKAIANSEKPKETNLAYLTKPELELYNEGRRSFGRICSVCHGKEGEGIKNLAPPLAGSEWVTTPNKKVTTQILLDGLTGPVHVNGSLYAPPEYVAAMPGLRDNIETNNGTIAGLLTYIRNSFGNKASAITVEDVASVRKETANRKQSYVERELLPDLTNSDEIAP